MKRLILAFLLAPLLGCVPTLSGVTEIDRGILDNREYRNESFGFSFTLPRSWHVPEPGAINEKDLKELDAELNQFMSSYEEETGIRNGEGPIYFGLFSSMLPMAEAHLTVYVADLSKLRGIGGAEDYLHHFASRFPKTNAIQIGDIITGEFGDRRFYAISTNAAGVRRMEYATVVAEYALVFSIVYETAEQLATVQRFLQGLRFDPNG